MKILIMCEGPNELKVINLLLDNDKLKFTRDDLLDMRPFHARQLTSPQLKPALDAYHGEIEIYRIGDKMSDTLKIPKELSPTVKLQAKFCTKPELEMLFIIAENKVQDFEKVKAKQKPKDFCKKNVVFNRKKYDNSTAFYEDYFSTRINLLISAITEYHRTHGKHKKDEGYLFDLLK
ncbi:MAG TPA: GNAT family acetyltransferase [Clostridiales bacterium]|nr:GNAT family acetyltransferase [Clostridiales bacterium]